MVMQQHSFHEYKIELVWRGEFTASSSWPTKENSWEDWRQGKSSLMRAWLLSVSVNGIQEDYYRIGHALVAIELSLSACQPSGVEM